MIRVALLPALMLSLACSSSATKSAASAAPADRTMLTSEEISRTGAHDAFSAVRALRPHWLSARGPASVRAPQFIKVYLDGALLGGVDYLRQITTSSISSMRHLDGLEATQRYGLDHGQGAILVFTREP